MRQAARTHFAFACDLGGSYEKNHGFTKLGTWMHLLLAAACQRLLKRSQNTTRASCR